MNQNKAFTLIELLAVIVILAIIALIATPIILNIIEKARKSAFQDTAYGLIETARLEYTEGILDGDYKEKTYTAPFDDLKFSGSKPSGGTIVVGSDGKIAIAIHNNKWCAVKEYEETTVRMIHYEEETCKITGELPKPVEKGTSFEEQLAKQTDQVMTNDPGGNSRYVGKSPNNYVSFNNELWRIIGVFDGQVKLIRDEAYAISKAWDTTSKNDWSKATLQKELNETYLDSIEETSKQWIDTEHIWNLGGQNGYNSIKRETFYLSERGTVVNGSNPKEWKGAIALMYASDYAYSTSSTESYCDDQVVYNWQNDAFIECKTHSWLYDNSYSYWTLTARSDYYNYAFYLSKNGGIGGYAGDLVNSYHAIKPTLYLKETVKIKSGTGTSEDPFVLTQ